MRGLRGRCVGGFPLSFEHITHPHITHVFAFHMQARTYTRARGYAKCDFHAWMRGEALLHVPPPQPPEPARLTLRSVLTRGSVRLSRPFVARVLRDLRSGGPAVDGSCALFSQALARLPIACCYSLLLRFDPMAIETSHGAARPTLPRSRDLPAPQERVRPSIPRGPDGRFAPGARPADHRPPRSLERRMYAELGAQLRGAAGELARDAWATYRVLLAELPCISPGVQDLALQRAVAATLARRYTRRALEAGLGTPEASEALSEAARWSQRDERLAVTTWDLSSRAAKAAAEHPAADPHAVAAAVFGFGAPRGSTP